MFSNIFKSGNNSTLQSSIDEAGEDWQGGTTSFIKNYIVPEMEASLLDQSSQNISSDRNSSALTETDLNSTDSSECSKTSNESDCTVGSNHSDDSDHYDHSLFRKRYD